MANLVPMLPAGRQSSPSGVPRRHSGSRTARTSWTRCDRAFLDVDGAIGVPMAA